MTDIIEAKLLLRKRTFEDIYFGSCAGGGFWCDIDYLSLLFAPLISYLAACLLEEEVWAINKVVIFKEY